ncbi:hypothetical protein M8C21_002212, partial [Ambrosia artemisiifolia]
WVCILRGELAKGLCGFERRGYADLGTDRLQSDELMMKGIVSKCFCCLKVARLAIHSPLENWGHS